MNPTDHDWFSWAGAHLEEWRSQETQWTEALSSDTKEVLEFARQAAVTLRHDSIGAEHLLAGLLKLDRGPAIEALKVEGLSLPALWAEIEAVRGLGAKEKSDVTWTPRAREILQRSLASARAAHRMPLQPADILIEVMKEEAGLPALIFRKLAIDSSGFSRRLETERFGSKKAPNQAAQTTPGIRPSVSDL